MKDNSAWNSVRRAVVMASIAVVAAIGLGNVAQAQTLFRPVAIVNDSAITGFDLAQRAQILVALGFATADADSLRATALDQLVEDRLKIQAGKAIGISPTQEIIDQGVAGLAQNQNISANEFKAILSAQGVSEMAIEDLASAEMIWAQVIRARFSNRVEPGEAEIDAELGLINQRAAFEYRIKEIGLALTADGRTEAETRALAEQLYNALNQGGSFDEAVSRFSRAPSAARGGDVGWVSTQRMPPDMLRALSELTVGEVSRPLSVPGGLSLLQLVDKRETGANATASPEVREQVRNRLIQRKSNRLSEGLLQEMRRDALIEVR
ncbi:MAG: peptidylprolyl isomerase [Pseudomonadota bacterium]